MNTYILLRFRIMIAGISLIVFTGCASTAPTKYYTLNSLVSPPAAQKTESDKQGAVGIRQVLIPDYLDRPQIVTRTGQNQIRLSDFNKWAGSLKSDISRVVAENLAAILSTDHVYVYPWSRSVPVKYILALDVTRFDGAPGGDVVLKVNWTIHGEDGKELLFLHTTVISEKVEKQGYDALVAAKSRLLEKLSQDIALAIRAR